MARAAVDSASDCEEDPHLGGYIFGHNNDSRRCNGVRSHVEHNHDADADDSLGVVQDVVNVMPQNQRLRGLEAHMNGRVRHQRPSRNRFRNRRKCGLCVENRNHHISNCYKFLSKPHKERKSLAEAMNLCLNCLNRGHTLVNCISKNRCQICSLIHHTALHRAFIPEPRPAYIPKNASQSKKDYPLRLELIPLTVRHQDSCVVVSTYAWLGGAVNQTICSERLLRKLRVNPPRKAKHVHSLFGLEKRNGHVVKLILQGLNMKQKFVLEAYSTPTMTDMDDHILDNKTAKYYSEMFDIEIPVLDRTDVDLLLGTDILGRYPRFYGTTAFPGCPNVSLLPLGWVVHGADRRMKRTDRHYVSYTLTLDCTQSECCREG